VLKVCCAIHCRFGKPHPVISSFINCTFITEYVSAISALQRLSVYLMVRLAEMAISPKSKVSTKLMKMELQITTKY